MTWSTVLSKRYDSGHPCLGPDFRENALSFPFSTMLSLGLLYIPFIVLRHAHCISSFFKDCIVNG